MDILKLIHSIACSICQSTEKPKPQIEVLEIVSAKAAAEIDLAKMKLLFQFYWMVTSRIITQRLRIGLRYLTIFTLREYPNMKPLAWIVMTLPSG